MSRKRRRQHSTEVLSDHDLDAKRRFLEADNHARSLKILETAIQGEHAQRVHESMMLNGQEFVNRFDYIPVGYGFEGGASALGMSPMFRSDTHGRHEGQDWPFILTDMDISYARGMARFITTIQCPAIGIKENLLNYVIGTGPTVAISGEKHCQVPQGLVPFVQDLIDEFLEENHFPCDLDRELFWRACRDGEYFLAFFPQRDGFTKVRIVEPELVIDPGAAPWAEEQLWRQFGTLVEVASNWRFGVHTPDHDVTETYGYCVQWDPTSGYDYLPDAYVEHCKFNTDRTVKRGLTDFYPAWKWLNSQARLLANTGEGATELSAISYIIQHSAASASQVASMRSSKADASYSVTNQMGNRKTFDKEYKPPGSKLDVPKGQEYLAGPAGHERGNAFLAVVQGILRQVGTRWCHDTETECFTDRGWLKYDQLTMDTGIGTYNTETGKLEFQKPSKLHVYDYAGPMVYIENVNVDAMVTPDHRMYVKSAKQVPVGAGAQCETKEGYEFVNAISLLDRSRHQFIPTPSAFEGGVDRDEIVIPEKSRPRKLTDAQAAEIRSLAGTATNTEIGRRYGVSGGVVKQVLSGRTFSPHHSGRPRSDRRYKTGEFVRFLGYWLSEGWTTIQAKQSNYRVGLCQNERSDSFAEIRKCMDFLGVRIYESISDRTTAVACGKQVFANGRQFQWEVLDKSLCVWLRENCGIGSREKRIPAEIKSLSTEHLEVLLECLVDGDGSRPTENVRLYHTSSRQLADDVQEIAIRCGYYAKIAFRENTHSGLYTVTFKRTPNSRFGFSKRNIELHEYIGKVWCVTVPNGTMITRRNGKPLTGGNCMTEGMISGDDSANTHSSMVEAGSRFHSFATARQGMCKNRMARIIWKAMEFAYKQGVFRRFGFYSGGATFRELKRILSLQIEFPDVDPKRAQEATQKRSTMRKDGVISLKTYRMQEHLDPEEEEANIAKEPQPQGGPGGPGGAPGGMPPMGGEGGPGGPSGDGAEGPKPPQAGGVPPVPKVPETPKTPDVPKTPEVPKTPDSKPSAEESTVRPQLVWPEHRPAEINTINPSTPHTQSTIPESVAESEWAAFVSEQAMAAEDLIIDFS